MPFINELVYRADADEIDEQLVQNMRIAKELVRLESRDQQDRRDTPRTILARMNWNIHTWTQDNPSPDRDALAMLRVHFPEHEMNTLLALLSAENVGLGTLAVRSFADFKRDALDPAKRTRHSAESRTRIRDAVSVLGHCLNSVWEALALPEARDAAGIHDVPNRPLTTYIPPDIDNLLPDDFVPLGWIWPSEARHKIKQATGKDRRTRIVRCDLLSKPGTILVHVGDCLMYPEARFGKSDGDAMRPTFRAQNAHRRA